jgi:hypothetical protein
MKYRGRHWLSVAVVVVAMLALFVTTASAGRPVENDPAVLRQLAQVRHVTAKYHDLETARADGYVLDPVCAALPDGSGAMGYHAVNYALFADPAVSETQPEALLYGKIGDKYHLLGVEWLTPDIGQDHPELFGVPFDGPMPGHAPGMPVHYDLHAWIWFPNPSGIFAPWNPLVSCN